MLKILLIIQKIEIVKGRKRMNNSFFRKTKRLISGVIAAAMAAAMLPVIPVMAEDTVEKYPYTMFAGSNEDGAITVNAGNFCVNGNVATNGAISASGNMNINGAKMEKANEEMIYIIDKIDTQYFSDSNVDEHTEDYTLEEMNININRPTEIIGEATLTGNININTALKALEDVNLNGEVKNTNNSIIFSKYGDIVIDSQNVNLNGLVYAPFGNVEVTAQNLNLNNVVIIADSITFNCPSVNANYSGNAAEFTGTISEPLNIPYEEWQYMKDENENEFPDFFEDMNNWSKLVDTDGDKLPDCIEQYIGSNPELIDTDADGIDDYYEVFILGTDPAKPDSDDNGILDSNEDFDSDGLINIQEYYNATEPFNKDTDNDGLSDGDEVNIYGTDPLKTDTDDDGLEDGDEIYFECDPLNPDSDGNGVLDGEEKRFQTFTHIVENKDCAVKEVIVSMEGTGNLKTNTTIESMMNKDMLSSNVVGLIGEPFSIETTSQFEKATLTYVIDKSKLGNTAFDNLLFLWYDEENDEFVELDTVLDEENSTVSVETTHFSKYILVDKVEWFNAWKKASLYFEDTYEPLATVICYDCSGSMSSNDRTFNYNIYNEDGTIAYSYPTCYRKLAIDNYIDSMTLTDKTALISYESTARLVSGFSNDKDMLKSAVKPYNGGGTNAQAAVKIAIDELEGVEHWYTRHIILLSDGDVNISEEYIQKAQDNKIKIHTIGLGYGASNSRLKSYAESTGGQFFAAATAEELEAIYNDLSRDNHFDLQNMEDLDEDGLPDEFEVSGLVLSNANIIYTDPENPDCDGDGLLDGEEISIENPKFVIKKDSTGGHAEYSSLVFRYNSNPWNKDTDGDEIYDKYDLEPLLLNPSYDRNAAYEYAQEWSGDDDTIGEKYNKSEYPDLSDIGDCANFVSQCLYAGKYKMNDTWRMGKTKGPMSRIEGLFSPTGNWNFKWTPAWTVAYEHYEYFKSEDYAMYSIVIKPDESIHDAIMGYDVRPGDLLYFCNGGENPTHATIITSIEDNDIRFCGHSKPRLNYKLSEAIDSYEQVIIVCLSGRIPT